MGFVGITKNTASSRFKSVFLKQAATTVMRMVRMMMMLMLRIMMLMLLVTVMLVSMMIMMILMVMLMLVHAQDNVGDDDNYGDNNGNDSVAPCCCCFPVSCQTLPQQKIRVSWASQTKTLNMNAKLQPKAGETPVCRTLPQNHTKQGTKTWKHEETENRFINKKHTKLEVFRLLTEIFKQ